MTCVKQTVTATIIAADGTRFVGTNNCRRPQPTCPRAGMPTGKGYQLCIDVCQQVGHAEVVALRKAGDKARGAWLFIEGHTYMCDPCGEAATAAGIKAVILGPPWP